MANVIVTVIEENGYFAYDMELAGDRSLDRTKKDILEALGVLRQEDQNVFGYREIIHKRSGKTLEGTITLGESSIWNGDYLIVRGWR